MKIQNIKNNIQTYIDEEYDSDAVEAGLIILQEYVAQLLENIEENRYESSYEESTCP